MIASIYLITNTVNRKQYIGYTAGEILHRWMNHVYGSTHESQTRLHQAIRKHGKEHFTIETIYMSKDTTHARKVMEPYFIGVYGTYGRGYNMTPGGDGLPAGTSIPCTPEKALNISKAKKGRSLPHMKGNIYSSRFMWVTDSSKNLRVHKDEPVPEGYHQGRINIPGPRLNGTSRPKFPNGYKPSTKPRKPRTEDHTSKLVGNLQTGRGTVWANDGTGNFRLPLPLPDGFQRGRVVKV